MAIAAHRELKASGAGRVALDDASLGVAQVSVKKGGKPQAEHRHLKWFNALSAAEQKEWCERAKSVRPIDAWREFKRASRDAEHRPS
jgi:hypothetical protein